jgi:hypothetical protein
MAVVNFFRLSILLAFIVGAASKDLGIEAQSNIENAPVGCTKLNSDADWPPRTTWEAALPGVIPIPKIMNSVLGVNTSAKTSEDYRFRVKTAADVQKAVNFARENNLRLTVMTTGHDFMGRSAGASGLLIDTSLLTSVNVLNSFTPTTNGAPSAKAGYSPKLVARKASDALDYTPVTIGAGIGIQALNNVLAKSKLFAHGAAHGMSRSNGDKR